MKKRMCILGIILCLLLSTTGCSNLPWSQESTVVTTESELQNNPRDFKLKLVQITHNATDFTQMRDDLSQLLSTYSDIEFEVIEGTFVSYNIEHLGTREVIVNDDTGYSHTVTGKWLIQHTVNTNFSRDMVVSVFYKGLYGGYSNVIIIEGTATDFN